MYTHVVSIVRDTDLEQRVLRAIELMGGLERFIGNGDKVLIKPNLVDGKPYETGETVHPETVRAIIRCAKAAGAAKITVGDAVTSKDLSLHNAYGKVAREEGADIVNFDDEPHVEVGVKDPVYFGKIKVAKNVLECDVLINVPTLKTHHLAGLTVSFKNLYGALSREDRIYYHKIDRIEEVIVDLNIVKPSDVIIVDGTYSTHHFPPFETQRLDLTLAGNNSVEVDTVAARIMGVDPRTIRYLRWAEEHGLGTLDLSKIRISGLSIEEAFRKKTVTSVDYVNKKHDKIQLINGDACTGCFGRIATALFREYNTQPIKEKVYVFMGPEARPPDLQKGENVILCGDCLAPTFYNRLQGEFVRGCPPDLEAFRKAVERLISRGEKIP